MKTILELRAALAATKLAPMQTPNRLTPEILEQATLPFEAAEDWGGTASRVTVVEYGCVEGATYKTIAYVSGNGKTYRATPEMLFVTAQDALIDIQNSREILRRDQAEEELKEVLLEEAPAIVDRLEALENFLHTFLNSFDDARYEGCGTVDNKVNAEARKIAGWDE